MRQGFCSSDARKVYLPYPVSRETAYVLENMDFGVPMMRDHYCPEVREQIAHELRLLATRILGAVKELSR
jgi:hypothetical protein